MLRWLNETNLNNLQLLFESLLTKQTVNFFPLVQTDNLRSFKFKQNLTELEMALIK